MGASQQNPVLSRAAGQNTEINGGVQTEGPTCSVLQVSRRFGICWHRTNGQCEDKGGICYTCFIALTGCVESAILSTDTGHLGKQKSLY